MIGDIRKFKSTSQLNTNLFRVIEETDTHVRTLPSPNTAKPPVSAGITWIRSDFEKGELVVAAKRPQQPTATCAAVEITTLREAVQNIRALLRYPNNQAAQTLARISADTLEGYLPEIIEAYIRSCQSDTPS